MKKEYTVEIRKPLKGEKFLRWNKSMGEIQIYKATYDFEQEEYPVISAPKIAEKKPKEDLTQKQREIINKMRDEGCFIELHTFNSYPYYLKDKNGKRIIQVKTNTFNAIQKSKLISYIGGNKWGYSEPPARQ